MMVTHDGNLLLELFQQGDLLRGEVQSYRGHQGQEVDDSPQLEVAL